MISTILITILGLVTAAAPQQSLTPGDQAVAAMAQEPQTLEGKVSAVQADQDQIKVKVGEHEYSAVAKKTKLLDANGKEAKLSDFVVDDKVKVTVTGETVTTIQKVK